MIWSAARLFHGRQVRWGLMLLGAAVWLVAWMVPAFAHSAASRVTVSSVIVASYTFLIAGELLTGLKPQMRLCLPPEWRTSLRSAGSLPAFAVRTSGRG